MSSVTFLGETDEPDRSEWRLPVAAPTLLLFAASFVATIVAKIVAHPFNGLEIVLVGCIALLPVAGLAVIFLCADNPIWPFRPEATPSRVWPWRLVALMFAVAGPVGAVVLANQWLDRSPSTFETYTILDKWEGVNNRSTTYNLSIESRHPSLLPQIATPTQTLGLTHDEYRAIEPGRTTVTLATHPGALRLPWYERALRFSGS